MANRVSFTQPFPSPPDEGPSSSSSKPPKSSSSTSSRDQHEHLHPPQHRPRPQYHYPPLDPSRLLLQQQRQQQLRRKHSSRAFHFANMPIAPPPPTNTPSSHHRVPPPPPMRPWYFYTSPQVLDDPLSPLPTVTPNQPTKYPPRPFSAFDTKAIETAYQDLLAEKQLLTSQPSTPKQQVPPSLPQTPRASDRFGESSSHHRTSSASPRRYNNSRDKRRSVEFATPSPLKDNAQPVTEVAEEGRPSGVDIPVAATPGENRTSAEFPNPRLTLRRHNSASSATPSQPATPQQQAGISYSPGTSYSNPAGTTSNPFIRAATKERSSSPAPSQRLRTPATPVTKKQSVPNVQVPPSPSTSDRKESRLSRSIPVGAQRLHQVKLPDLTLEPIYWSPLVGLDNAGVVRGTWFYRDTMLPVETEKANALEKGYMEVQAWTEEWSWELESAVRVGEDAEAKIRWSMPNYAPTRPGTALSDDPNSKKPSTMMSSGQEDELGSVDGSVNDALLGDQTAGNSGEWVIFADGVTAYIMRDSLLAGFAGSNRRPLAQIKRGKSMGTCVVRGFDEMAWREIYGEKMGLYGSSKGKIKEGAVRLDEGRREERQKITDLVLVIHGIGQKLSERMDSFNFTHATNSFRRHVNLDLRDPNVKPILRNEGVGIMILPINWRAKIKLEAVDNTDEDSDHDASEGLFSLADITPRTIPAVRNLIGDVMVDIPYYLSHHKQKMVSAVVKEANRVYGLWCENNPGFREEGRVHLIAHSLGSAIALDILSAQPTLIDRRRSSSIPRSLSDAGSENRILDFDTTNLFCVGSPAGFFLLLNRKGLLPRKGRKREDTGEVSAERGVFGCLAVDNVYNVIHYSDPIAYRLNPTIDTEYAASLRPALVPSTAITIFSSISSLFTSPTSTLRRPSLAFPSSSRSNSNSNTTPHDPTAPPPDREAFERLPSNMELETHDFTREEIAEKRMFLLNDNGQIDWYLRSGGTFESAYLNMLGAHSSYWESKDFVRFLVIECGRVPGRRGVLRDMVAVKRRGIGGLAAGGGVRKGGGK